jgi:hypothetical protein
VTLTLVNCTGILCIKNKLWFRIRLKSFVTLLNVT